MSTNPPAPSAPPRSERRAHALALAAGITALAAVGWATWVQWEHQRVTTQLLARATANDATLQALLGEVTRMRLEQSAGTKGPQALLEKLQTYAPMLTSSRFTEPDYQAARKEMAAIVRAFASLGQDAKKPIEERMKQLTPTKDYDELKWLLEAYLEVDPAAATELLQGVLLGQRLPSPRLRWLAAEKLTERNKPLAQQLLRRVLETESSRGFNPDYAAMYPGAVVPDAAAMDANGFFNYVVRYGHTDDPQMEDTLLKVMGRSGHDASTIRECVKLLGERRSVAAIGAIQKAFREPPLQVQDPVLLGHCLQALVDIQGKDARPFLEEQLPKASNPAIANRIQALLNDIASGKVAAAPPPPAKNK